MWAWLHGWVSLRAAQSIVLGLRVLATTGRAVRHLLLPSLLLLLWLLLVLLSKLWWCVLSLL